MDAPKKAQIDAARQAALEVLLHNAHGPFHGLPRTAGWGYPEPYTRDLLISILGILASDDPQLIKVMRNVLETLAKNQTQHGHIPSLVHEKDDRGSSDTTPLFLLAVGIYRNATGQRAFLQPAVRKALTWMEYQSPSDRYLVAQQPTSDWRDEQWVIGCGLFVNTVVYSYLRLLGQRERAEGLRRELGRHTVTSGRTNRHLPEGLALRDKPYYAFWSYKIYSSERFDLLGNSLAILSGLASPSRAGRMITWIEAKCLKMRRHGELAVDLPPNFFPFIQPTDPDWLPRYEKFNRPGDYHNGGIWPFVCGFYIAALVAAKKFKLAEDKLSVLTELLKISRDTMNDVKKEPTSLRPQATVRCSVRKSVQFRQGRFFRRSNLPLDGTIIFDNQPSISFGFNEWFKAQTGKPMGQDWQSWSAAMYLYAAQCVEERRTPFFDEVRGTGAGSRSR